MSRHGARDRRMAERRRTAAAGTRAYADGYDQLARQYRGTPLVGDAYAAIAASLRLRAAELDREAEHHPTGEAR